MAIICAGTTFFSCHPSCSLSWVAVHDSARATEPPRHTQKIPEQDKGRRDNSRNGEQMVKSTADTLGENSMQAKAAARAGAEAPLQRANGAVQSRTGQSLH